VLADVDGWFSSRGFGILLTHEGDEHWANLTSRGTAEVVVPKYGRGSSPEEAARRARERYEQEQER
jgi:hypothetical protein